LETVTWTVPDRAISCVEMTAISCVGLDNVVGRLDTFQSTSELETNPDPLTVNVNEGPAVAAEAGDKVLSTAPDSRRSRSS
jgi:hypothetical protein